MSRLYVDSLTRLFWQALCQWSRGALNQTNPEVIARYLMSWASQKSVANRRLDIHRPVFVRQQLDQLGLGRKLTHYRWGAMTFNLPPSSLSNDPAEE
jgi:hypothetical protein